MAMIKKKPAKKGSSFFPAAQAANVTANSDDGGGLLDDYGIVTKGIEFENKKISLANIRLNPDNEIFRNLDEDDDIMALAEDIKRNGLLHNLVAYPAEENGAKVYVLISGERRYRALKHLAATDDAKWNLVDCKVITTELSPNEKKVLLYSANLQVRGGFGDEKIRRKAVAEFVDCLQKEPYNLTPAKAKAAIREISPMSNKSIDYDLRIENELDPTLLKLLDEKFLLRRETDDYLRLIPEHQRLAASRFEALKAIDDPALANERERVRRAFRDKLLEVPTGATLEESKAIMQEALDFVDGEIERLQETETGEKNRESVALDENKSAVARNAITKNIPDTTKKVLKILGRKNIQKSIAARPADVREEAYSELKDLRDAVDKLMQIIEGAQ